MRWAGPWGLLPMGTTRACARDRAARIGEVDPANVTINPHSDEGDLSGAPAPVRARGVDELLCPEIVGRTPELAGLVLAVTEAENRLGTGTVLFGEAGSGKSRLLAEVRTRARHRGLQVLRGRVLEGGNGGFGPFPEVVASALRTLDGHDARLRPVTPVLRRVAGTDVADRTSTVPPTALAEALLRLLAAAAQRGGGLLLVEDVHWADGDTLQVLDYLVANAADHGCACILSVRPQPGTEAHRVAGRWADARLARRIDLAPLGDTDVDLPWSPRWRDKAECLPPRDALTCSESAFC